MEKPHQDSPNLGSGRWRWIINMDTVGTAFSEGGDMLSLMTLLDDVYENMSPSYSVYRVMYLFFFF